MPLSGRLKDQITPPALAAIAAIIMKKLILSIELQKLPSQPAAKLPMKLVLSHRPIIGHGAIFETNDKPMGDR